MTTVRDQIVDAIEQALATVPGPYGVEIDPPGEPDVFPHLAVFRGNDREIEREAHLSRREGMFTVEGTVEGGGRDADSARTALHAASVAALMADQTLGLDGMVEMIDPADCRWHPVPFASSARLMFAQDFIVQFVTVRNDPAQPA